MRNPWSGDFQETPYYASQQDGGRRDRAATGIRRDAIGGYIRRQSAPKTQLRRRRRLFCPPRRRHHPGTRRPPWTRASSALPTKCGRSTSPTNTEWYSTKLRSVAPLAGILYSYQTLVQGFAARMMPAQAAQLEASSPSHRPRCQPRAPLSAPNHPHA